MGFTCAALLYFTNTGQPKYNAKSLCWCSWVVFIACLSHSQQKMFKVNISTFMALILLYAA
jgi:hypothetical protein